MLTMNVEKNKRIEKIPIEMYNFTKMTSVVFYFLNDKSTNILFWVYSNIPITERYEKKNL